MSNNIKTAISEVRPWLSQDVTVGTFEITKDMRCIDVSGDKTRGCYFDLSEAEGVASKATPEIREKYVWGGINESFSRPVHAGYVHIHDIPTQYLSAQFKAAEYDGIIYKSSLTNEGYNIALFNPQNARLRECKLFKLNLLT